MDWSLYAPTPKMVRVLIGGLFTAVLMAVMNVAGVDLRTEVQAFAPVIVGSLWGWAKEDASSPGFDGA